MLIQVLLCLNMNCFFNLAILHLSGKVDSFIDKLMISELGFASTSAPSFKNLEGISSIPGALETSKQHSSFLVMFSVMYRRSNFSVFGFSFL